MRLRLLFAVTLACVCVSPADSSPHGHDLWQMRLGAGVHGRWLLLDAGHAKLGDHDTPLVLLGLAREDRAPGRYYEMQVIDGRTGSTLWTYDGTGSDYVDAGFRANSDSSADLPAWCMRPVLRDVDNDGSDDVVFVEQDFVFGTVLRAVRIEP